MKAEGLVGAFREAAVVNEYAMDCANDEDRANANEAEETARAALLAYIRDLADSNAALLKVLRSLVAHGGPHDDWACARCVPHSDMLLDGFACGYHAALDLIAKAEGREGK